MEHCLTFRANFIFSRKVPWFIENYVQGEFIESRNKLCDLFNPHYEEWNNEFDTLFPGLDGYSMAYKLFIREKQAYIIREFNRSHKHFVTMISDEECDVIGVFKYGKHLITVKLTLIQE